MQPGDLQRRWDLNQVPETATLPRLGGGAGDVALDPGSFKDAGSATLEAQKFKRTPASHKCSISRRRQGSAPGIPPTARSTSLSPQTAPGRTVLAAPPRGRGESEPRKGPAGGRTPPRARPERENRPPGARAPGGGGAGLTWRGGRQGARAAAAAALPGLRATAPPGTVPPRSGRGRGARRPGSSAPGPGPGAPAPPRAPAAAGTASTPAASPSRRRAVRIGRGKVRSTWPAHSLIVTFESGSPASVGAATPAFTKMAAPADPNSEAILVKEAPRAARLEPLPSPFRLPASARRRFALQKPFSYQIGYPALNQ